MTLRTATAVRPRKRVGKRARPAVVERHKNHDIYFVPGLRRGLLVLEALAAEGRPLSVADIGKRIGLTRSSMFRLAYTLQHMGFVEEIPASKLLRLGPRVLNIGYAYLASQTLIELARPDLEALRDRTGVSSHLAILDGGEILYLSCIQTRSGFLSNMNVGTRLPAYATPMGWLLLADRSARELSVLYPPASFVPLTDQTPRNVGELAQRIATAVAAGHAISHGAVEPGGSSIAAPVRDRDGSVVAAIDVSAPDSAFDMAVFKTRDVREVMDTATRISARLGHSAPRVVPPTLRSGVGRRNSAR
ncbi:MAG TPA: IclR family transcriptional regulator [Casimicrobiaceae bacterium]|nr:IclR family transcriptional regulator [Casimicrobiaceae bacterium]